jgi:apolipoprotein N-acyltransferase
MIVQHVLLGVNFTLFLSIINFHKSGYMSISAVLLLIVSSFFYLSSVTKYGNKKKNESATAGVCFLMGSLFFIFISWLNV